ADAGRARRGRGGAARSPPSRASRAPCSSRGCRGSGSPSSGAARPRRPILDRCRHPELSCGRSPRPRAGNRAVRRRRARLPHRGRRRRRRCRPHGTSFDATPRHDPRSTPVHAGFTSAGSVPRRMTRIGVQLPEVEREVRWQEYLAMATAAEEARFDSIYVGDHLLYRGDGRPERGPWAAWELLAALAAITERAELGPLVACAAFHPPAVLAKMAATVTEISGGRFVLALGAGWNEAEFRAFGIPFDRRVARFAEAFPIIRGLLRG